jgi:hypothetical protein
MKEYYVKNYIDEMKMVGYESSDFVMEMFYSYFSECENNKEYRARIQEDGKDFLKYCAAYAQWLCEKISVNSKTVIKNDIWERLG